MSFTSTDSFDVGLLIEDDDMDINPFWSSDEEEEEDKKNDSNKENQNNIENGSKQDPPSNRSSKVDRDSGIELSDTKDTVNTNDGSIEKTDISQPSKPRLLSEGSNAKPKNVIYNIKDKDGKIVKEDDFSREYSKQKSDSEGDYI